MNNNVLNLELEILSRLDLKKEYSDLGVEILKESEKTGNFLVKNPYKSEWGGECFLIGRGVYNGFFLMRKGAKIIGVTSFFDLSSDYLPGACGNSDYTLKYYAKKTGVNISDFQTNGSIQDKSGDEDTTISTFNQIERVATLVESASADEAKNYRKGKKSDQKEWKPPDDLNRPLPSAPEFPAECLPDVFKDYVLDVATRYQCQVDK